MKHAGVFVAALVGTALLTGGGSVAGITDTQGASAEDPRTWTFMMYMAADVGDELPWLQDVNEMEAAYQADGTNIIVLLDPPDDGDTRLLEIVHDEAFFDPDIVSVDIDDGGEVLPLSGEVNTGSPETLRDFIEFSAASYPADNLILVLWGHGAGWRGLCPDGYDLLTLPELRSALAMAQDSLSSGLDMVVLDICTGSTAEMAIEIEEYAEFMVGSQLGVPAEGLPYADIFNGLASSPGQSLPEFGAAIVDEYIEWAAHGSSYPVGASLLDLGAVGGIGAAVDAMSDIGIGFDGLFHEPLVAAVNLSEYADGDWLVDLGAFSRSLALQGLPLELAMAAASSGMACSDAVIHHAEHSPDGSDGGTTGMSLYVPSDSHEDDGYVELRISDRTSWPGLASMLRTDRASVEPGPGPEVTIYDSDDEDDLADSATVAWDVTDEWNYTSFTVHVFRTEAGGLVDCGAIHSTSSELSVTDIVGRLTLSTSAGRDGEVLAYHSVDVTLSSTVIISVTLQNLERLDGEDVRVALVLQNDAPLVEECTDASCEIAVAVPDWADVGETLKIQVLATDDSHVLSEKTVLVSGDDVDVTMTLYASPADAKPLPTAALVLWSVLAVLVVAVAVSAGFAFRKRRSE
ncbi:MAG: hypothetical protein JSV90_03130 [Methanobacteriota archaeon]|nr:MAG: hypothetical protein JSV90_03130 [Euryarchaeota archaeon]